ncbi:hypothetical protein L1987_82155 [Smallanthus sonchifolius]|uniref:Uncharacterized protein n=1 Tax=Smallanthus sonchifolius TaxID=185202 RepID=A0ACB8YAQ5_9ASTR|nr:hypothetical protein L1987_82155 [Smallanthus sonchifolius]
MSIVGCSGENTHLSNIGAGNATRGSLVCTAGDCIMPNHMRIHDKDTQPHIIYILVYTMGVAYGVLQEWAMHEVRGMHAPIFNGIRAGGSSGYGEGIYGFCVIGRIEERDLGNRNSTGTQNASTWKWYYRNFTILTRETKKNLNQWWESDIRHNSTRGNHLPNTCINGIANTKNAAEKEHNLRSASKLKPHGAKNTFYYEEMVDGREISGKTNILVDPHSDSGDDDFSSVPIRRTSDGEDGMEILPMIVMNKEYTGGLREWEKLCLNPMHISWPKPWCLATSDPIHWEDIMSSVRQNRMMAGNEKERSVWLDIDRDACQEEEAIHRQKMKKRKTKGKNPFTSVSHQQTNQGLGAEQGQDMGQKRKFMRVRVGKDMVKDAGETQSTWKSRKNRMDNLKKEIATKEARLEEIASNINATDTNSALRNSILKMKGSKLVKFSAKLNADGGHNYRERPPKPISTYERNIVNPKSQGMNPDKDGQQDDNKTSGGEVKTCGNSIGSSIGVQADGDTGTVQNEKQKPGRTAQVHVIETRNSFQLLDAEGNIMTDDTMVNDTVYLGGNQSQEINGNWQRKQERVLNTRFHNSLTQDQRFEAKRFVLDKLVPLDSSLSEWSTQLIEYFRQLCSIYEFGDGYLAVSRDRIRSMGREETVYEDDMEDVDSETDGTANMMKSDTITPRPENEPMDSNFEGVNENTHQFGIVGC